MPYIFSLFIIYLLPLLCFLNLIFYLKEIFFGAKIFFLSSYFFKISSIFYILFFFDISYSYLYVVRDGMIFNNLYISSFIYLSIYVIILTIYLFFQNISTYMKILLSTCVFVSSFTLIALLPELRLFQDFIPRFFENYFLLFLFVSIIFYFFLFKKYLERKDNALIYSSYLVVLNQIFFTNLSMYINLLASA